MKKIIIIINIITFLSLPSLAQQNNLMPDTENCLHCHRYPGMGRYDEQGIKKVYYINETLYANSVHGKLKCTACHIGLDKIPHTDVKKVDCTTKCHIKEPSTNREFSHANMEEKYDASVHGNKNRVSKPFPGDLPTCKYCHSNQILKSFGGKFWGRSDALVKETLARCQGCHTKEKWADKIYSHFTHRMRRIRTQEEIVQLCTSCHEDREKMARHGLESIETYKDTFHWILVKYGVDRAPDCVSCHVPVGYTTHDIRPRTDSLSPIHKQNRVKTCSNQGGIQVCHPNATEEFANGRIHAYGVKAQLATDDIADDDSGTQTLLLKRAMDDVQETERFRYRVISFLKMFYKILIFLIVGSMAVHNLLDYLRSSRRIKRHSEENHAGK